MRANGKDWLSSLMVLICASATLSAQWREIRFATNHIVSHVIAADDGRGMVFLTDSNVRVVTTRDYWRTFDTVLLPRPEFPYVFEPFSYDTTANGTVVVVGQHRPPLDTIPSVSGLLRYCNTATAAYYSTDWGATWTEVLPRQKGRYMSISFRGRPEGILLYELDWNDSLLHTETAPMSEYRGRDLITVDQRMQALSRIVLEPTQISQRTPGKSRCIEGNPIEPSFVDRINDSTLAMQTVLPCKNDLGNEDDPSGLYRNPYYIVDVSTNNGRTWDTLLRRVNVNFNEHTENITMKIVNDTSWIDNQGYFYEGSSIKPRKLKCPELLYGEGDLEFWRTSDAHQETLLWMNRGSQLFPTDSAGIKKDTFLILSMRPPACKIDAQVLLEFNYVIGSDYRYGGKRFFKPQLLKDGRAVVALASIERSLFAPSHALFHWSIFVLDSEATSKQDDTSIVSSTIQERNGEVVFSRPLLKSGNAEYYSLIGSLVASVPIQAGSEQTRIPQLQSGVYIVSIPGEVPLKILVW